MSELLKQDNTKVQELKSLIFRLHKGEDEAVIRKEFVEKFKYVKGSELVQMEEQLVMEGIDPEIILGLCDIHAALFEDKLEDIHTEALEVFPFEYFIEDNKKIAQLINDYEDKRIDFDTLYSHINDHYSKKEQIIFPVMEHIDIKTIPQVMWGKDNEIKALLKESVNDPTKFSEAKKQVIDMITKEENILQKILVEHLTDDLWMKIDQALKENKQIDFNKVLPETMIAGKINLPSGTISVTELEKILNVLPIDITFVDRKDRVAYVSQGKHRIFDRPLTVLGREVRLCHPPQSLDRVEAILNDMKNRVSDHADFWIKFKGMYVYIQYFAIYADDNTYLGCVEVTQDIQPLQEISGEKRL